MGDSFIQVPQNQENSTWQKLIPDPGGAELGEQVGFHLPLQEIAISLRIDGFKNNFYSPFHDVSLQNKFLKKVKING